MCIRDSTHPCRWQYALVEASRPNEYLPIEEDSRGSYIMNSKDLNLLRYLPKLMDLGITSLKVEGRVKSSYYVAVVTKVYREAIDTVFKAVSYTHLDVYKRQKLRRA